MRSALPQWLVKSWLFLSPLGLLFAARIAWEKTIWTWTRGPQMVGFSLMHIHPLLGILGALSCSLLLLWLIPAGFCAIRRRRDVTLFDIGMLGCCLFALLAVALPDAFFA